MPAFDLVDIGANLTHSSFSTDLERVLQRAKDQGVEQMVLTGATLDSSVASLQMAQYYPQFGLYATAGVHPHHASEYTDSMHHMLAELLSNPLVVSGGECGLDYNRNFSPREDQRHAFERQLTLAIDAGKPVFLHQRDAHADFIEILKRYRGRLKAAVVHCFTDTDAALTDYLALDCHIGITGWICDERRGTHLIESVKQIPANRLMIETDAPYLLPRNIRPLPKDRRNLPEFLPYVLQAVAQARGVEPSQLALQTSANARAFFGLPAPQAL